MSKMKFAMVIQAIDKITSPVRGMAKAVGDMTNKAERGLDGVADDAAKSRAKLTSVVKPIGQIGTALNRLAKNTGLDKVGEKAGALKDRFGSVLKAIAGGSAVVTGTLWGMDAVAKGVAEHAALAKSVGMSASSLSAWAGMVKEGGYEADNVADLVEEMNNKIGESKGLEEITPVTESLKMLNLQAKDLAKLAPEKQFEAIMNAALKLKDKQQAVSAVDILMGGEANKILGLLRSKTEETGKGLTPLLDAQKELNLLSEEGRRGNVSWARASGGLFKTIFTAVQELTGIFGGELAPVAKEAITWITNNFGYLRDNAKLVAKDIAAGIRSLMSPLSEARKESSGLLSMFIDFVSWLGPGNTLILGLVAVVAGPLIAAIAALTVSVVTLGIALWATPIGWIIAGIAALVVAGGTLYAFWDEFAADISNLLNGIKTAFSDGLLNGVLYVLNLFNPVVIISKAVNALINYLFGVDLFAIGQEWMSGFGDGIQAMWENISNWLSGAVNELLDVLPDWIKSKIGLETTAQNSSSFTQTPSATPSALPENGKANVGGTVKVAFENAPSSMRVTETKSDNPAVGLDVDAGYNMAAF